MWYLFTAFILLCALTLFIIATWNKCSSRDIIMIIITAITLVLIFIGTLLFKSYQKDQVEKIQRIHNHYQTELKITRQEVIQETMEAYYKNNIQTTVIVVDGVIKNTKYDIRENTFKPTK